MFKILRWSLVPVILFFATPSQAMTLNPKNIGAFMYGLSGVGTNYTASQALSGFRSAFSPFSIGMTLGAYAILRATDYALQKYNFVPGINNPNIPAPAGWTDPNQPPNTYPAKKQYGGQSAMAPPYAWYDDGQSACTSKGNWFNSVFTNNQTTGWTYSDPNICTYTNQNGTTSTCTACFGNRYTCQGSDTLSGQTCTVVTANPNEPWPSDGTPTLIQDPTHKWINHPRDPDKADDVNGTSSVYTRTGTDQWGNPIRESFRNNTDGGMTYIRDSQTTGSNSAPSIYRDRLEFDSTGNLVDSSTGEFPNVWIDANPEEKTPGQEDNSSNPDSGDGTTPTTQGDCDKYPDAIGCTKYGTPQNQSPLQERDITGSFNPTPLQGSNSCPAPLSASFLGVPLIISYDFICQFAIGIKSIVLVISTLIAMYIVLGYSTGGRS